MQLESYRLKRNLCILNVCRFGNPFDSLITFQTIHRSALILSYRIKYSNIHPYWLQKRLFISSRKLSSKRIINNYHYFFHHTFYLKIYEISYSYITADYFVSYHKVVMFIFVALIHWYNRISSGVKNRRDV